MAKTDRLVRGQQFHREVQAAFLTGLVAAAAQPEHVITLSSGRRRIDLLVLPQLDGEATAVVEIKNTDWERFADRRVRPNLRRHMRQLQQYLDHYVSHLRRSPSAGSTANGQADLPTWDTVIGVLLYPRRPREPARARLIEDIALTEALTVAWYDETDWRPRQGSLVARPSPPVT